MLLVINSELVVTVSSYCCYYKGAEASRPELPVKCCDSPWLVRWENWESFDQSYSPEPQHILAFLEETDSQREEPGVGRKAVAESGDRSGWAAHLKQPPK